MKIKIMPLNLETDLLEISSWDDEFYDDHKYDSIKHFILEDNAYIGIGEVIQTNYEKYEIGTNERKFALSIKDDKNKIIGFVLALIDKLKTSSPELLIQYIVIHPNFQGQGIGTQVLTDLIYNPQTYFKTNIGKVFSRIENNNYASRQMFKKLGFNLAFTNSRFMKANITISENNKE